MGEGYNPPFAASSGSVDSVGATSPIASSGGANPDISYNGGTLTMLSTSFLQGSTAGWQLGSNFRTGQPTTAALQPITGNNAGSLVIAPSGTNTQANLTLLNTSDLTRTNTGVFQFLMSGAAVSLVTNSFGTGPGITSIAIGEAGAGANLAAINFQFSAVVEASISKLGVLSFPTVTGGLSLKSGSNARVGSGTLATGTLAVANTSVTANSLIIVQNTGGGVAANVGVLTIASQTAGTGFTVTSSNLLDTSTFKYFIVETA